MALVDKLVEFFKANARANDRMGRLIERIGLDTLRKAVGVERPAAPSSEDP